MDLIKLNTVIQTYLSGRKTYLLVSLGLAIIGAIQLGLITVPPELQAQLGLAITLAAIAALRASGGGQPN